MKRVQLASIASIVAVILMTFGVGLWHELTFEERFLTRVSDLEYLGVPAKQIGRGEESGKAARSAIEVLQRVLESVDRSECRFDWRGVLEIQEWSPSSVSRSSLIQLKASLKPCADILAEFVGGQPIAFGAGPTAFDEPTRFDDSRAAGVMLLKAIHRVERLLFLAGELEAEDLLRSTEEVLRFCSMWRATGTHELVACAGLRSDAAWSLHHVARNAPSALASARERLEPLLRSELVPQYFRAARGQLERSLRVLRSISPKRSGFSAFRLLNIPRLASELNHDREAVRFVDLSEVLINSSLSGPVRLMKAADYVYPQFAALSEESVARQYLVLLLHAAVVCVASDSEARLARVGTASAVSKLTGSVDVEMDLRRLFGGRVPKSLPSGAGFEVSEDGGLVSSSSAAWSEYGWVNDVIGYDLGQSVAATWINGSRQPPDGR